MNIGNKQALVKTYFTIIVKLNRDYIAIIRFLNVVLLFYNLENIFLLMTKIF